MELLLGLLASQNGLVAVDDHDKVTAIHVGGKIDLLLATQQNGSLGCDAAQRLAGGVEQVPLALHFSGLHESSAHIYFLLISIHNSSGAGWGAKDSIYHQKPPVNTIFCFFRLKSIQLLKSLDFSRILFGSHVAFLFLPDRVFFAGRCKSAVIYAIL